ncbi:MAG: winged helix-turn-helix domain-containing protein [Pseudomonadota bacterium]
MGNSEYLLGAWTVLPQRHLLKRDGQSVSVTPKSMAVLERLVAADGQVVSREELHASVWAGGVVTDDALTQCIVELRKALGDAAREPKYIETITKRGFRIVAPVAAVDQGLSAASSNGERAKRGWLMPAILLLAISLLLASSLWPDSAEEAAPREPSVAVMPFDDLSPGGDQGYFADGLADEIITRLAELDGLLVIGRGSSFRFRDSSEDLRAVGESLDVDHVVEGSVRLSDSGFRISARLVAAASGVQLWAESFDRPLEDIFSVQEDIADAVATALSVRLGVNGFGSLPGGTQNVEAYEAFMRAKAAGHELDADNYYEVLALYRAPTEIDPEYALAWSALASVYRHGRFYFSDLLAWQDPALAAMRRARSLAPDSATIAAEAAVLFADLGSWTDAEHAIDTAASAEGIAPPHVELARIDLLVKTGRIEQALSTVDSVRRREPLWGFVAKFYGHLYASQGRTQEALAELDRGYELDGKQSLLSNDGVVVAMTTGDRLLLEKWLARAVEWEQTVPGNRNILARMSDYLDQPERAREWLTAAFVDRGAPDYWITIWAAYHGDPELALRALKRTPDAWSLWMPVMADVRRHPGFADWLEGVGLVTYWDRFGWADACTRGDAGEVVCQ